MKFRFGISEHCVRLRVHLPPMKRSTCHWDGHCHRNQRRSKAYYLERHRWIYIRSEHSNRIDESFTINSCPVCTPRHWRLSSEFPLDPLAILLEFVFKKIVFVCQIGIGMNVAGVTAEYQHRALVHYSRMMVAGCGRLPSGKCILPRLILHIETDQIVQHSFAIIAAKYVNCVFVCDDCVFASPIIRIVVIHSHEMSVRTRAYEKENIHSAVTHLAPTNSSHSSIRFHCSTVSNGVKSSVSEFSPVHDDGNITFCCLYVADIFFFRRLLVLGFIWTGIFLFFRRQTMSGYRSLLVCGKQHGTTKWN